MVLPKGTLLRRGAQTLLTADRQAKDYTVAGLPGAEARAQSAVSRTLMTRRHPKAARVVRDGTQIEISDRLEEAVAGRLKADPHADAATIFALLDADTAVKIDWSQLSFSDIGIAQVAAACQRRSFVYSDARTGYWKHADTPEPDLAMIRLKGRYHAGEVVLASIRGEATALRHSAAELRRFGFPVAHLVEMLAESSKLADREFTVAGVAYGSAGHQARGLWLEIRPGHLVEVTGAMLTDVEGRALSNLIWMHFAPGDQVVLALNTGDSRSLVSLRLERWRQGPRAGFALREAADRVLLPVGEGTGAAGSIPLGAGRCRLVYPAGTAMQAAFPPGTAAWLTGENRLPPPDTAGSRRYRPARLRRSPAVRARPAGDRGRPFRR